MATRQGINVTAESHARYGVVVLRVEKLQARLSALRLRQIYSFVTAFRPSL